MAKSKKRFTINYNGEPVRDNEVMVAFEYTEADAENCINPDCIQIFNMAGKTFKVIYKAVPKEWEKQAKSAFNLIENETLGHYAPKNSVSVECMEDEYELELVKAPSAEELIVQKEVRREIQKAFADLMLPLIDKAPKIGFAVLLMYTQVKGEEFYTKMKLSRNAANRIQQQVAVILKDGLANLNLEGLTNYRSTYDEYYKKEAVKLLADIIED